MHTAATREALLAATFKFLSMDYRPMITRLRSGRRRSRSGVDRRWCCEWTTGLEFISEALQVFCAGSSVGISSRSARHTVE